MFLVVCFTAPHLYNNTQSGLSSREVPFRSIDLGEVALRPYLEVPTRPRYERICTQNHEARQWARSQTGLFRKAVVARRVRRCRLSLPPPLWCGGNGMRQRFDKLVALK